MKVKRIVLLFTLTIFLVGCSSVNLFVLKDENFKLINKGDKIVRTDGAEEVIEYDGIYLDDNTAQHVFKVRFK